MVESPPISNPVCTGLRPVSRSRGDLIIVINCITHTIVLYSVSVVLVFLTSTLCIELLCSFLLVLCITM